MACINGLDAMHHPNLDCAAVVRKRGGRMSTIVYEILSAYGTEKKRGEPVVIADSIGMTFGVHCDEHARADDEQRFVVTNIETGMRVGSGATRDAAIDSARKKVRLAIKRGTMAHTFEASKRTRAAILAELGVAESMA
ncbi:hypothetical protein DFQ28_004636 [Apophysomyces sp. BC1034]|nr:hypothetical protein DFQ28_004636 [Apophysomyces sp. BC1034]